MGSSPGGAKEGERAPFYGLVRLLSRPAFAACFRLRREGLAGIPRHGPLLVAANHVSYLDPAVLGSAFPRPMRFLMIETVWRKPGMNWFFRWMRAIPVDRTHALSRQALRQALAALAAGEVVGIFPEGGRATPGGSAPGLAGVALLARRSSAPVLPVGIEGTDRAMPVGAKVPRPAAVVVRFGEPLVHASAGTATDRDAGRAADLRFTKQLMDEIRRLSGRSAPVSQA